MKKLFAILFLVCVACEEQDGMIECQIDRSGNYEVFDVEEIESCDDKDGDGWPWWEDCNDERPDVHPLALELYADNRDNDCDGEIDELPFGWEE